MRAAPLITLLAGGGLAVTIAATIAATTAFGMATEIAPAVQSPAAEAPAAALPQAGRPDEKPHERVHDCTSSGCHAKETAFEYLHAPVAAGACEMCHKYADETTHTFRLQREGAALCSFCHIGKADTGGLHVHKPVEEGKCIECHSPHGSSQRLLINAATVSEMCLTCHTTLLEGRPHVHSPIAKGDCLGCHKAHNSVLPKLMVDTGRALCLRCHTDIEHPQVGGGAGKTSARATSSSPSSAWQDMNAPEFPRVLASGAHDDPAVASDAVPVVPPPATAPASTIVVHKPLEGECTQCHEQHASKEPALLKQEVGGLCSSCHEPIATAIAGAKVKHSAVSVDRACLNCHTPHTSIDANLLRSTTTTLCLECHTKPVKRHDGTTVESVASMAAKGQHLHGPIEDSGCSGCHDVHGGSHRALLVKPYSESFYQPFDTEAYALCFSCHKSELITEQRTASATAFRNGEENLHYVHVVAQGNNGRSCRSCHATHSAKNIRQLAETVKFGEWDIPLRFNKLENGGSCAAGCHPARTYDRIEAIPKPAPRGKVPAQATPPAPATPPAQATPPAGG